MKSIKEYREIILKNSGRRQALLERKVNMTDKVQKNEQARLDLEQAQTLIQSVARQTQEMLRFYLEDLVQMALDTCFPDEYQFQVIFEIKRERTEARLCFVKNGEEINPMDSSGGGAVDVASWGLRIAAWTLGKTDNVIILDEPFRFLDKTRQPLAAEVMSQISKQLGIQFIMVTHNADIIEASDRVFRVTKQDGISRVEVG